MIYQFFYYDPMADKDQHDESGDELAATDLSVGEILRRSRKQHGQTLRDVSSALRIRPQQLEALEKEEWHRLPGQVYTIGFLRSYAEYLGLDGDKMVKLLKMQSDGFTRSKPRLSFPAPPSDNRAPGWGSVITAICLICISLYFWDNYKERAYGPEENLRPILDDNRMASGAVGLDTALQAEDKNIPIISPDTLSDQIAKKMEENKDLAQRTKELSTQSTDSQSAQKRSTDDRKANDITTQADNDRLVDEAESDPDKSLKNNFKDEDNTLSRYVDKEDRLSQDSDILSQVPNDGNIVITATASSWVEIIKPGGETIFSRVLRPGDKYIVPDDQGDLILATGNAGGLRISLQGRELGRLGERGLIIRGIKLVPEELKRYILKERE